MTKLLAGTLLLLITTAASLALIRATGAITTANAVLNRYGFGVCNDVPCFQSIVPGTTAWTTAADQYPERRTAQLLGIRVGAGLLTVRKTPGADVVGALVYTVPTNRPTDLRLGDFIQLYGPPCLVQPGDMTSTQALITFPFGWAVAVPHAGRLRTNSRLLTFAVNASVRAKDRVWDTGICPGENVAGLTSRWHGFARADSYQLVGELRP